MPEIRGNFSPIFCGNLIMILKVSLTIFEGRGLGIPGVFNSHTCPHWAPAVRQLQFSLSYLGAVSWGGFCSWLPVLWSWDSLYSLLYLSNFEDSSLSCVLPYFVDPRIIDFSVCLAFDLLGWSIDSQASCLRNQKLELLSQAFNKVKEKSVICMLNMHLKTWNISMNLSSIHK